MDSLANHVAQLLKHAHDDPNIHKPKDSYQSGFEGEGIRKTEFIVNELKQCEKNGLYKVENCVAVSVGGADGSDLDALLANTSIKTAFLIEYSDEGAQAARARGVTWKMHGKNLAVLQGDATMRKSDLIGKLRTLAHQRYTTLVLIFLGVLHELPRRSTEKYDLRSYIGELSDVFPNNSIFISEPCAPLNWPEEVEIKIADLDSDLLRRWSLYIKKSLWDKESHSEPVTIGNGYVRMSKELAAETLFKTIRRHDVSRHLYEIGERLTSFDPDAAVAAIRDILVDASISKILRTSDGFTSAYIGSDVKVRRASDGVPCPPPDLHIKIIAHSVRSTLKQPTVLAAKATEPSDDCSGSGVGDGDEGISPPILKIDLEYYIDLTDLEKILFFREAEHLRKANRKPAFGLEFAHMVALRKRLSFIQGNSRRTAKQRSEFLRITENLSLLEERSKRFHSVIDAFISAKFRILTSNFGTEAYYLEVANIFEKAIRFVWTRMNTDGGEYCDVIAHTGEFKNGPYISLRLEKTELSRAQERREGGNPMLGPPEEYEGRIVDFSPEVRLNILYPSVIYLFLRDGFTQPLLGEYQSLDRWHVSPG